MHGAARAIAAPGPPLYGESARLCRREGLRLGPVAQWLEPTAHNGLVGGSSPPGPTIFNAFWARTLFDRSRMFAFSSRISLANRWSKHWEAHLVRDEGVAGSNPATPTNFLNA